MFNNDTKNELKMIIIDRKTMQSQIIERYSGLVNKERVPSIENKIIASESVKYLKKLFKYLFSPSPIFSDSTDANRPNINS